MSATDDRERRARERREFGRLVQLLRRVLEQQRASLPMAIAALTEVLVYALRELHQRLPVEGAERIRALARIIEEQADRPIADRDLRPGGRVQ